MKTVQRYSSIIILCFVVLFASLALVQAQSTYQSWVYLPILVKPFMAGDSKVSWVDGMAQRYVPAGNFTMGSDNGERYEQPVHTVYLDGYWIDETEVTNGMYVDCVAAGYCTSLSDTSSQTRNHYYRNPAFDNYPVINIDWFQAEAYCTWAGRQLPTEAQWEKAARGTDARTYPWGEGIDSTYSNYNNYIGTYIGDTTEVGSYPKGISPYGALDMAGNVLEWVADWYDRSNYMTSPQVNPTGPESGNYRALRGGSWVNDSLSVRSASRSGSLPDSDANYVGFRCSQSLIQTPMPTPIPTAIPIPTVSKVSEVDGMVQYYVPAGDFTMGSSDNRDPDEQPVHTVYLDEYWIDGTEVTNGMYARCVAEVNCPPLSVISSFTRTSYYGNPAFDNYPVVFVNWSLADIYCTWAGRQLPTEAQWEKAARGTDSRTYPWGEEIDCTYANYNNCVGDTSSAGSYPKGASLYGALDMAGNVMEWVADRYAGGSSRVQRGGSWESSAFDVRASYRDYSFPAFRTYNLGFRCAE